ncbi:hypothetical protein [Neobacillus bataviensis]|uniref:hypothetical protein n=1 Tax=Neobacillus bataviensis TaxID=220685 RepID=UPI001CBFB951|nr:hypothetical protein [Neobacillus bataviensis]
MKKGITILMVLIIGIVIGIFGQREYQKFHPKGNPTGMTASNEDSRVKVSMFVSVPIQTFKGKIIQLKTSVENKTDQLIILPSKNCKPVFEISHYYGDKKVDENTGECLNDDLVLGKDTTYFQYTILPYNEKYLKKYKTERIAVTAEGVTVSGETRHSQ